MGTRADFYVGRGSGSEWLGSIAWDGYDIGREIPKATTESEYREAVAAFLKEREDATYPKDGWPWPWKNSSLTDYAYAFDAGAVYRTEHPPESVKDCEHVWVAATKRGWAKPKGPYTKTVGGGYCEQNSLDFPDMSKSQRVTFGSRSGVMIFKTSDKE